MIDKEVLGMWQSGKRNRPVHQSAIPAVSAPQSWGSSSDAAEFQAVSEIYRFKVDVVDLLAKHFGGQRTLNHLRVGNFIGLCCQCEGRPTSNQEIAQALGLSRATVSRIVSDFIQCGWVAESPHPEDGRKRLLVVPPDHPRVDHFERALRKRLSELNEVLREKQASGEVLPNHREQSKAGSDAAAGSRRMAGGRRRSHPPRNTRRVDA